MAERFGTLITHLEDISPRISTVLVGDRSQLVAVARFLQGERRFEHLALITAVDYKTYIELVYNFWSYSRSVPFAVKVRVPPADPVVPSLAGLWATANWHEREEFDLMGVRFDGHPDLRRILLPDDWKGHPLRKDYDLKQEQFVSLDPVTGQDRVHTDPREGSW